MGTFHSLGVKILRNHIEKLGFSKKFSIVSGSDTQNLAQEILMDAYISEDVLNPRGLCWMFSRAKNMSFNEKVQDNFIWQEYGQDVQKMFEKYRMHLKAFNTLDFDDLINLPTLLLSQNEDIQREYHRKINYILIDEFQDTNPAQYQFIRFLLNKKTNIFVVGDDDQSIYGWRGADLSIILNFKKEFPQAKLIRLEHNYRSTDNILEAANQVICKNKNRHAKRMKGSKGSGDKIELVEALDEEHEAQLVGNNIQKLVRTGTNCKDIALLMRTNIPSRPFEEYLRRNSIPYKLVGAYNFFDRKEVKDCLAYLKVIANIKDEFSMRRIINYPKRGIGNNSVSKINDFLFKNKGTTFFNTCRNILEIPELSNGISYKSLSGIHQFCDIVERYQNIFSKAKTGLYKNLKSLVDDVGIESQIFKESQKEEVARARLYNVSELVSSLKAYEDNWDDDGKPSLFDYLNKIMIQSEENDEEDDNKNQVQIMTVHMSKGLEFPHVFIVGLEEGMFPSSRAMEEREDAIEEERRLFYVALTRAEESLHLSACQKRKKFGEIITCQPSPFLADIDDKILVKDIWNDKRKQNVELTAFKDDLQKLRIELL